ncbi:MAG: hypothetical protein HY660_01585, partial [Armatimonadetes bacterium]|nr:hypothetical protein [Armatimonadota bacterium]
LKSWVLGAVGRVLAEEHGIHSIHGACVEKDGAGILYIAPTGTGKSTSSYGLIESPRTRFHSDDWVYVRYTFETKDGRRVAPQAVKLAGGREIRGYRLFGWIGEHGAGHPDVVASGLDLANAAVSLPLRDLDLSRPIEAYAYTSEKVFYLRTNLVENFPPSAYQMLRSNMENVPNVTTAFLQTNGALLDDLVNVVRRAGGDVAAHFAGMADGEVRELLARLIAFDNARAMLDIARVLPADRVYSNPMEPARLGTVILLKRNFDDPVVLETLTPERFMGRLLLGETPEKKREIAYNAYRAVDDEVELGFVRALDQQARAERGGAFRIEHLYQLYAARPDVPETLEEEFALFHVMTQACRCYDLNTILTRDPLVADKKDAVALTMELIAYAVSAQHEVLLTLETYRQAIGR